MSIGFIFLFTFLYLFIYLAVSGLSCGTWDLQLQHMGSLVVACEFLVVACGIQFPDQGSNPGPLRWERRVLVTGTPWKSLHCLFIYLYFFNERFLKKIFVLFIYSLFFKNFWLHQVLVEAHGIFHCGARALCCGARASLQLWRTGYRARGLCNLQHVGSLVEACGLSIYGGGLSCPMACGILVPRPGIKTASPALESGFFTTGPPGKSPYIVFFFFF